VTGTAIEPPRVEIHSRHSAARPAEASASVRVFVPVRALRHHQPIGVEEADQPS
jgi:hypothetical protein